MLLLQKTLYMTVGSPPSLTEINLESKSQIPK